MMNDTAERWVKLGVFVMLIMMNLQLLVCNLYELLGSDERVVTCLVYTGGAPVVGDCIGPSHVFLIESVMFSWCSLLLMLTTAQLVF